MLNCDHHFFLFKKYQSGISNFSYIIKKHASGINELQLFNIYKVGIFNTSYLQMLYSYQYTLQFQIKPYHLNNPF